VSVDLHALYRQVVLDHNRHPRNYRVIEGTARAERENRVCGDRVTVYLRAEQDVIVDISFQGSGCAIVKASASLMTESVMGRTRPEANALVERFRRMVMAPPGSPIEDLGELTTLAGVRQFPIRVKCATLPWEALRAALAGRIEEE
jgi:nitrogen fixation protein NifU and related proteins